MPPVIRLVLLVFAFVCFALSTYPPTNPNWNRLVSLASLSS